MSDGTDSALAKARKRLARSAEFYARQVGITLAFDADAHDLVRRNIDGLAACWAEVCACRHLDGDLPDIRAMTPREVAVWRLEFGRRAFLHAIHDEISSVPREEIDAAFARLKRLLAAVETPRPGVAPQ